MACMDVSEVHIMPGVPNFWNKMVVDPSLMVGGCSPRSCQSVRADEFGIQRSRSNHVWQKLSLLTLGREYRCEGWEWVTYNPNAYIY